MCFIDVKIKKHRPVGIEDISILYTLHLRVENYLTKISEGIIKSISVWIHVRLMQCGPGGQLTPVQGGQTHAVFIFSCTCKI